VQDTISKALNSEQQRLSRILQEKLTSLEIRQLDELLSDSEGLYEITNLKREAKDFTLGEIRRESNAALKSKNFIKRQKKFCPF
jgi:hypothetical protein